MSKGPLVNVIAASTAQICAHSELKKEARVLLHDGMGPREFVEALIENKQYIAGIDFIAHALPQQKAVWWGCLCLQHTAGNALSAPDKAACQAAVRWVLQPTEGNRAAAEAPAEAAGPASAAGRLATAVYLTGADIAPPDPPPVSPAPFAPAKAVAGAVKLASTKADPVKIAETQRLFVELGLGVADGRFT
jgi:hypothetical protein